MQPLSPLTIFLQPTIEVPLIILTIFPHLPSDLPVSLQSFSHHVSRIKSHLSLVRFPRVHFFFLSDSVQGIGHGEKWIQWKRVTSMSEMTFY